MKTGIDVIEIERVAKAVSKSERFRQRVFTKAELQYCRSRGRQADASLAGIFSAKEAFLKALGTGMRFGAWTEVEITHDEFGAPNISVSGNFGQIMKEKGLTNISVSISHCRNYAMAQVIIE